MPYLARRSWSLVLLLGACQPPASEPVTTAECDVWAQDCGPGEKCSSFAQPSSEDWEWSTRCIPAVPNPLPKDAPCEVEEEMFERGPGYSGVDECDAASVCWDYTFEGDLDREGTCQPRCTGSEEAPVCAPGSFCGRDSTPIRACLDICDPRLGDCPADLRCSGYPPGFTCLVDTSSESVAVHGPCNHADDCAPGLLCWPSTDSGACDPNTNNCCLSFCDTTLDPDPACSIDAGETCESFYEMVQIEPPPELKNLGVCVIAR